MAASTLDICLVMIVRNEAHVIANTLQLLLAHVPGITHWIISDTGSTDSTPDIVRDFWAKQHIPGVLRHDPWQDFGTNRSIVMAAARATGATATLMWDADDSITGTVELPSVPLSGSQYAFKFGDPGTHTTVYWRPQLFNNAYPWRYEGVLHEFATCDGADAGAPMLFVQGPYFCTSGRTGARSQDPNKYAKDAAVFEAELAKNPGNARYVFYCGNSYRDAGNPTAAAAKYRDLLAMKDAAWVQERYVACLNLATIATAAGDHAAATGWWVYAVGLIPSRPEAVALLVQQACVAGHHALAVQFAAWGAGQTPDTDAEAHHLFGTPAHRRFTLPYFTSISAITIGHKDVARAAFRALFAAKYVHGTAQYQVQALFSNLRLAGFGDAEEGDPLATPTPSDVADMVAYRDAAAKAGHVLKRLGDDAIAGVIAASRTGDALLRPAAWLHPMAATLRLDSSSATVITITACKRWPLLRETLHSMLDNWTDLGTARAVIVVDDHSSDTDCAALTTQFPFVTLVRRPGPRGHRGSMNWIHAMLVADPTIRYWVQLEDDWRFVRRDAYITRGQEALAALKPPLPYAVAQVAFNRHYAETFAEGWAMVGSAAALPRGVCDGVVLHSQDPVPAPGGLNCAYWPHFTFRPSMLLAAEVVRLGPFDAPQTFFERGYADKWTAAGLRTAFFDTVSCIHTGNLTTQTKDVVPNAYVLNGVAQFSSSDAETIEPIVVAALPQVYVINLVRRPDRKAAITKQLTAAGFTTFCIVDAVDGSDAKFELDAAATKLFAGNPNPAPALACALSHLQLWKRLQPGTTAIIIEDDCNLNKGVTAAMFAAAAPAPAECIVRMFGYSSRTTGGPALSNASIISLQKDYAGGTFAYAITHAAATALLAYYDARGITKGLDTAMSDACCDPASGVSMDAVVLCWSTWCRNSAEDDSDIQFAPFVPYIPGFVFYPQSDSLDNDIRCESTRDVQALAAAARSLTNCVAFNTFGYLKHSVSWPLVQPPCMALSPKSGIWVAKSSIPTHNPSTSANASGSDAVVSPSLPQKQRVLLRSNWCSSADMVACTAKLVPRDAPYCFTTDSDPAKYDLCVVVNSTSEAFDPARTLVIQGEPWVHDTAKPWGVRTWGPLWSKPTSPPFLAVHGRNTPHVPNVATWQMSLCSDDLQALVDVPKPNGSVVACVTSSKRWDPGHLLRLDFLRYLEADGRIPTAIFGSCHDQGYRTYVGPATPDVDKEKALLPFKYCFMAENCPEPGFITEKLWEPLLTETLCFYWGAPDAETYLPQDSFVRLPLDSPDGFLHSANIMARALAEDWHTARLPAIRTARTKVLNEYSFDAVVRRALQKLPAVHLTAAADTTAAADLVALCGAPGTLAVSGPHIFWFDEFTVLRQIVQLKDVALMDAALRAQITVLIVLQFPEDVHKALPYFPNVTRAVVWNTEQMSRKSERTRFSAEWSRAMRTKPPHVSLELWDYSAFNARVLSTLTGQAVRVCPTASSADIEALRCLRRVTPVEYDYVCVGLRTAHRSAVVLAVASTGAKVLRLDSTRGQERDRAIASARVLLNVHADDERRVFESVRCTRWLQAGMRVVTEPGEDDDVWLAAGAEGPDSVRLRMDNLSSTLEGVFYATQVAPLLAAAKVSQVEMPTIALIHCHTPNCSGENNPWLHKLRTALRACPVAFTAIVVVNVGIPIADTLHFSNDASDFELPTLRVGWFIARAHPTARILYMHTKGTSWSSQETLNITAWTDLMLYWTTTRAAVAMRALQDGADAVGPLLQRAPCVHFSGNFWWTTGKHLGSLPLSNLRIKHDAEMNWVTSQEYKRYVSLFDNPGNDLYMTQIPKTVYMTPVLSWEDAEAAVSSTAATVIVTKNDRSTVDTVAKAQIPPFVFFPHCDSRGGDIACIGPTAATALQNCVAFNTLGNLKHKVQWPLVRPECFAESSFTGIWVQTAACVERNPWLATSTVS